MDVGPTIRPNGRTVVLVHGKNFSGAYWEPTIRVLAAGGFRVVVPDQIGFGKSTKPAAFQFSFQVLADTTRALLDSLHIDRSTVGRRDRTAIGRGWAPKDVAATLGDYPTLGRKAAAAIPGAKLVEIEGAGHLPQVEAFERYRGALFDFIR